MTKLQVLRQSDCRCLIGVATSTRGVVCKKFPGGKGTVFSRGSVSSAECNSFEDLRDITSSLKPNQCIVMGVPVGSRVGDIKYIGSKRDLRQNEITRSKNNFVQSGFILVDYDYSGVFPCTRAADVHAYMCKLLPDVFKDAGYLAVKSSSSRVLKNQEPIKDGISWHLYYRVDAPKQVKWLADNIIVRARELDMNYYKRSKDNRQLERTVIDLQPLKIGGCGIVYEADPIVEGGYTLIPKRTQIIKGGFAKTSVLKPVSKGVGVKRKETKKDNHEGFWKKSRSLHYSDAYRRLSPADRDVLDDLCMQYKGRDHGTERNPIKCPYTHFIVHPSRVRKALVVLQEAGFIRYISNQNKRSPNLYYLNFEMLFMTPPAGWTPWN